MTLMSGSSELFLTVAIVIAATAVAAPARGDIVVMEGVRPWDLCAECHSLDGVSAMARFPKLAGQRAAYIAKQVRDFAAGRRTNDGGQMAAIASDISGGDLEQAAAYFSALPAPPPDKSVPTDTAEWRRGARLYEEGDPAAGIPQCRSCHEDAETDQPQGPLLNAQHAAYLAKELQDWRAGARANDETRAMTAVAAKLSDQDIAALAAYLASTARVPADPERPQ